MASSKIKPGLGLSSIIFYKRALEKHMTGVHLETKQWPYRYTDKICQ